MGFPTILFDAAIGNDGNLASGAGPVTAVVGSVARSRSVAITWVGFFEGSPPDLSGVAVDGTHALKLGIGGAGRQWFKILAKKDTQQSTTGDISIGSNQILNVASTAGMSIGDVIKVGSDYSAIQNIVVSTITMDDNATANTVGATLIDPKQITVENTVSLTSDTAWAVGGVRGSLDVATQLWADLLPGWTVAPKYGSGTTFTLTDPIVLNFGGDATNGPITFRGVLSGTLRPKITAIGSVSPFTVRAPFIRIENFITDNIDAFVLVDSAKTSDLVVSDVRAQRSTGVNDLVRVTAAANGSRFLFRNLEAVVLGTGSMDGIDIQGEIRDVDVENSFFYGGSPASSVGIRVSSGTAVRTRWSAFYRLDSGINYGSNATTRKNWAENCYFDTCAKGITTGHVASLYGAVIRNNTFSNCSGFALDLVAGSDAVKDAIDYNNFWQNNSNYVNVTAGAHDTYVDPQPRNLLVPYAHSESYDFGTGQNLKEKGWPTSLPGGATKTFVDIGCVQRREPIGGNILARITGMVDLGTQWEVRYVQVGGALDGQASAIQVPKSSITQAGQVNTQALMFDVLTALRDVAAETLVGQEGEI